MLVVQLELLKIDLLMDKNSKNILIISPFFYPEPISTGKFNTDMVLALRDQGHQVKVLCFHPFYPKWKVEKSNHRLKGVSIIRGGKNLKYTQKTFVRRMVLEIGFAFFILRKIFKHQKEIDIVIPVFPPSLAFYFSSFFLKKRIKKVGMVHDLQEIYSNNKKGIIFKFIGKSIHYIEKKTFQSCDQLIFLSNEMKETAKHSYDLAPQKLKVQYPFVTIDLNKENKTNDLNTIFNKEKKHIVYSGALGEKQNPKELYDFFNYCSNKLTNVTFHFFSQGTLFQHLKDQNKNDNICFHDLVPKENIEELYEKSFVQIVPQATGTSKGSLPSKLPNLLATKTNILCITDKGSEIDTLFKENKLQKVINSWDRVLFLESIKEFLSTDTSDNLKQLEISNSLFNINSMINIILEE